MTGAGPAGLCPVEVAMSMVVPDDTSSRAWSLLREFGRWGDFHGGFEGAPVRSSLLLGDAERTAGARRVLCLGAGKLVEQLAAFDEDKQSLSFKLITHPANVNPFSAAFVNSVVRVRVRHSTLTAQSLVEVRASFMTDPPAAGAMHARLAALHEAFLRGLAAALSRAPLPLGGCESLVGGGGLLPPPRGPPKPVGSLDLFLGSLSPRASRQPSGTPPLDFSVDASRQDSGDSARLRLDGHYDRFMSGQ